MSAGNKLRFWGGGQKEECKEHFWSHVRLLAFGAKAANAKAEI